MADSANYLTCRVYGCEKEPPPGCAFCDECFEAYAKNDPRAIGADVRAAIAQLQETFGLTREEAIEAVRAMDVQPKYRNAS